jgi:probable phosphoglycerate mutase
MVEILLIRHAVNDYVKTNRLAGWTPGVHLNEEGQAQAVALGYGDWSAAEIIKLVQRKMWAVIQQYPSRASFPNGEAMRDVQIRAVNAIEGLVKKHPRGRIAVVSHSDVIKMIVAHYLGMHLDLFQRIEISPASLTILAMGASRPSLIQLNENSYLPKPQKSDHKSENGKEPVSVQSIVVDAIGEPGARTFYLQAQHGENEMISVLLEKTQALMLADQADTLLRQLGETQPELPGLTDTEIPRLIAPEKTLFRAGNIGLQYDKASDRVKLELTELRGVDQGTPDMLNLWITRSQLKALGTHARDVAHLTAQ